MSKEVKIGNLGVKFLSSILLKKSQPLEVQDQISDSTGNKFLNLPQPPVLSKNKSSYCVSGKSYLSDHVGGPLDPDFAK